MDKEIKITDEKIDDLVCELYEITEEAKELIEGENSAQRE